jgi:hypothetical protein
LSSDEQAATASTANRAAGKIQAQDEIGRIAVECLLLPVDQLKQSLALPRLVSNRDSCYADAGSLLAASKKANVGVFSGIVRCLPKSIDFRHCDGF